MMGGSKADGFTIIETLIVMAVSGAMFLGVVVMIAGQQGKSQFQQSINGVTQQLQQTIGEVANGYFPTSNILCSAGGPNGKPLLTLGSGSIGTNAACILVGKVVQFDQTTDPQQYIVYPMAGLRQTAANQNVASLAAANPIVVAPGNWPYANVPDTKVTNSLTSGLTLVYTTYTAAAAPQSNVAFAILASPVASTGAVNGASGAQQVSLYAVNGTSAAQSSPLNVDKMNIFSNFVPASAFSICLASGTTNQSGLITIGGSGRQLTVTLAIKGDKLCS